MATVDARAAHDHAAQTFDTLVPRGRRVVIVAPHPDDEVLGMGGLMMQAQARGRAMLLVAVTDGTASHPDSRLWHPARLAAVRPRETLHALRELGVSPRILRAQLPDGAVGEHRDALRRMLDAVLRDSDVVVTTWQHDGHPDHEAVGAVCAAAAHRCGARSVEVPIWGCRRLAHHTGRPVHLPLDSALLARKRRAVRAFVSQLMRDATTGQAPILPAAAFHYWLRPFEVYLP
ncbi:MAG: PIG-L family deacetylase [Rhodocyclaceae bacterium]